MKHRAFSSGTKLVPAIVLATLLSACEGAISTLAPAGPVARDFNALTMVLGIGATLLLLMVVVLAWLAVRSGEHERGLPQNWLLGGLGIAFPVVVLSAALLYAVVLGKEVRGAPALTIQAAAEQHVWTFVYPDVPGAPATVNVLHVPAGVPVAFDVTGLDVIHSFWVPSLGGKIDAVPGRVNRIVLQADRPGRIGGLCAEYCGDGHAGMRFEVIVHEEEDYRAALLSGPEGAR